MLLDFAIEYGFFSFTGETFHFLGGDSKELTIFFYNSGLGLNFLIYLSLDAYVVFLFSLEVFEGDCGDLLFSLGILEDLFLESEIFGEECFPIKFNLEMIN